MDIDRTIAKLELKKMLNELLQTEDMERWTKANLSQFLVYARVLLPAGSRRFCFWKKYLSLDSLALRDVQCYLASRIELKRGYAVVMDEVPEDINNEDDEYFAQCIYEHEFFSKLKSAILENRFYIPQIPPPKADCIEMENHRNTVSFILPENKTAFAKLVFDLVGLED